MGATLSDRQIVEPAISQQSSAGSVTGVSAGSSESGWKAGLTLDFIRCADRTELRRSHVGPLVVQRPLYPEGDVCHAYLLHPPGGVVGGDELRLEASVLEGASGLITTPGACKFYRSNGMAGVQSQLLVVASAASLEWFPQENIYFDGCQARQSTTVKLDRLSRFIGWEINCFGRSTADTAFHGGDVKTHLQVQVDNKPALQELLRVRGSSDINRISGLRGCSVSGTLIVAAGDCFDAGWQQMLREILKQTDGFAVTCVDGILLVRYLGDDSEQARDGFIAAWELLRPVALQRSASVPRIWAT